MSTSRRNEFDTYHFQRVVESMAGIPSEPAYAGSIAVTATTTKDMFITDEMYFPEHPGEVDHGDTFPF